MFQFYWPWFALLLPLPLLARWILPAVKEEGFLSLYFPSIERVKQAFPSYSPAKASSRGLYLLFLSLIWLFLVLALMQPERVDQYRYIKNKGYDLMLGVDISGSMQAVDFSTRFKTLSRLDAAKDVVGNFILGRQGDRVGLVTFGEHAYLHVPLTYDTSSVSKMLNDTVSGMAGNATAIGDAIGISVRTLRDRPEGSRVLILLTDGVDNASRIPPLEAAKLAKQYDIKIYTIGIGSQGPVPVPTKFGGYGMAEVPLDEELLKKIAELTGGHYFKASEKKALESIYAKIDELEKSESDEILHLIREPLYQIPLAISMGILLLLTCYDLFYRRIARGS
jgi:Ca-activated chloride channel homolog